MRYFASVAGIGRDKMANGVAFNPPPASLFKQAMDKINEHVATLPPDADGAIVGVATNKGVNAAIVLKAPGGFEVQGWIGKNWGDEVLDYGGGVKKVFRFGK
jgi:hypothetical protein